MEIVTLLLRQPFFKRLLLPFLIDLPFMTVALETDANALHTRMPYKKKKDDTNQST